MAEFSNIPIFIGKYNFGQTIGRGSFSVVKTAQDTERHVKYAIKIIPKSKISNPDDMERFEREVAVILKMSHPGIVRIHDFLVDKTYFYLVMEYCGGETLLSKIPPAGKITEDPARVYFKQILETIRYIHGQGIAHRDLKLQNVLLDAKGHTKIIDFGFSRFGDPGQMFQTPVGTPAYAAPEVISGQSYDGKKADMWSLGVLLFCLVTGELPWSGNNVMNVFAQIKSGSFEPPEGVSDLCADLMKRLMDPNPEARLTADEASNHPFLDGIEVKWDTEDQMKLQPTISVRTFNRILTSGDTFEAQSPRSQLLAVGGRKGGKTTSSLSFGAKSTSPLSKAAIKLTSNGTICKDMLNTRSFDLQRKLSH